MSDILAKTIISEEATVRKAGGKFKMNPLFPSTTTKIKAVCVANSSAKTIRGGKVILISYRCWNKINQSETVLGPLPKSS